MTYGFEYELRGEKIGGQWLVDARHMFISGVYEDAPDLELEHVEAELEGNVLTLTVSPPDPGIDLSEAEIEAAMQEAIEQSLGEQVLHLETRVA